MTKRPAPSASLVHVVGEAPAAVPAECQEKAMGTLHGSRMRTKAGLMAEWKSVARFPSHFGGTWDALRDALADLPEGGTFLVLEADQVLRDAASGEEAIGWAVLRTVAQDLAPRPFKLILQASPGGGAGLQARLKALGL